MSHMHIGLSGRYTIEKRNAAGEVVQTLEFDNLITDAGLERWGTGGVIDRCYLGSGTATPMVTDTAMAAPLGSTTTTTTAPSNTYDAVTLKRTVYFKWRFAPGVCTGDVSEVGAGWGTGLWSRALVVDGSNTPITIRKAADETLDVTYAVQLQYPTADISGSVVVDGVSRTWVARAAGFDSSYGVTSSFIFKYPVAYGALVDAGGASLETAVGTAAYTYAWVYSGALGAAGSFPTGHIGASTVTQFFTYIAGSRYADSLLYFRLDSGNGTIRSMAVQLSNEWYTPAVYFQVEFDPPIVKNNTQTLKMVVRVSWGRA